MVWALETFVPEQCSVCGPLVVAVYEFKEFQGTAPPADFDPRRRLMRRWRKLRESCPNIQWPSYALRSELSLNIGAVEAGSSSYLSRRRGPSPEGPPTSLQGTLSRALGTSSEGSSRSNEFSGFAQGPTVAQAAAVVHREWSRSRSPIQGRRASPVSSSAPEDEGSDHAAAVGPAFPLPSAVWPDVPAGIGVCHSSQGLRGFSPAWNLIRGVAARLSTGGIYRGRAAGEGSALIQPDREGSLLSCCYALGCVSSAVGWQHGLATVARKPSLKSSADVSITQLRTGLVPSGVALWRLQEFVESSWRSLEQNSSPAKGGSDRGGGFRSDQGFQLSGHGQVRSCCFASTPGNSASSGSSSRRSQV